MNGVNNVLKRVLRLVLLSHAASAASKTLRYLSDPELNDPGLSRSNFVDGIVESVKFDLDAKFADQQILKVLKTSINSNLVGWV